MSLYRYAPYLWAAIGIICCTGFLIGVISGVVARLHRLDRPKYKVGLKVGSKTILYDPDQPPEQIVGLFDEAFSNPHRDTQASRQANSSP